MPYSTRLEVTLKQGEDERTAVRVPGSGTGSVPDKALQNPTHPGTLGNVESRLARPVSWDPEGICSVIEQQIHKIQHVFRVLVVSAGAAPDDLMERGDLVVI